MARKRCCKKKEEAGIMLYGKEAVHWRRSFLKFLTCKLGLSKDVAVTMANIWWKARRETAIEFGEIQE